MKTDFGFQHAPYLCRFINSLKLHGLTFISWGVHFIRQLRHSFHRQSKNQLKNLSMNRPSRHLSTLAVFHPYPRPSAVSCTLNTRTRVALNASHSTRAHCGRTSRPPFSHSSSRFGHTIGKTCFKWWSMQSEWTRHMRLSFIATQQEMMMSSYFLSPHVFWDTEVGA